MKQINPKKIKIIVLLTLSLAIVSLAQEIIGGAVNTQEIFFIFLTNLILSIFLFWLQYKIDLNKIDFWILLWLNLWIIGNVNNIFEGYFFTDLVTEASLVSGIVFTFIIEGIRSYLASFLLLRGEASLKVIIQEYTKNIGKFSLISRIILGSILYFPIYFFFGALISPFILDYYTAIGSGLKIPPFPTMIAVEIFRGFLYVLCLFPLFFSLTAKDREKAYVLSGMLFIPGALLPLLNNQELPQAIIPYHLVEIFADSIVYGYVLTFIFRVRK